MVPLATKGLLRSPAKIFLLRRRGRTWYLQFFFYSMG